MYVIIRGIENSDIGVACVYVKIYLKREICFGMVNINISVQV